jgi:hypothetical protein
MLIKILYFTIFFIYINPALSIDEFDFFETEILLESTHSYHDQKKNSISWSSNFDLILQKENIKKYKLENESFKIERTIKLKNKRIEIEDKYINKLNKKIGIISNYKFENNNDSNFTLSGRNLKDQSVNAKFIAENPTLVIESNKNTIGIYLRDLYSKINTSVKQVSLRKVNLKDSNLFLNGEETYIKHFYIYKFNNNFNYFDFINYLRKELNVFSKIDGNFFFINTFKNKELLSDPKKLKKFFQNYNVKYLLLTPWLDYDNYNFSTNNNYTRNEAKNHFLNLKKLIRSINPNIKLLIPLQSNLISLDNEIQNIIKKNNLIEEGFNHYSVDVDNLLKRFNLNIDKEELIFDENNKVLFETYFHDLKYGSKNIVEISLALKAYDKGYLFKKLVNQIDFVIDEIGFDGVYIDQLNQYYINPKHKISFISNNNNFADIDINTGKIINEYENIVLNTHKFEEDLISHLKKKTDFVFANTHHIQDNLRKEKIVRIAEGFWYFWSAGLWKDNDKKFVSTRSFYSSHLSTPVAFSLSFGQKGEWKNEPHNTLVKNLRYSLFNGNLIYFLPQDIRKLNLDNDKLNVFQKIYPIEVLSINEGIVTGKDKIITIKNLKLDINQYKKSKVYIFDKSGYSISNIDKRIVLNSNYAEIKLDEKSEILVIDLNN